MNGPPEEVGLLEGLLTTRAMRRFTDEDVSDEEVRTCLRAAVQAPSGGNLQPYRFVVVRDPERRARLGALYLRAWERYSAAVRGPALARMRSDDERAAWERNVAASDHLARHLAEVPVLVLVLVADIEMVAVDDEGVMDVGPTAASVYPAVQNLVLAARALGLGTTLTTVSRIHEDEVRAVCDVPDRYRLAALLPLGRPAGRFGVARRRPAEDLTSWDVFGQRERRS